MLTNHPPSSSGVFDPAMEKCPPDIGGSVEHVRGALPSVLSSKSILSAQTPTSKSLSPAHSLSSSAPVASSPRPIHYSTVHTNKSYPITPPLTPDSTHSASSFTSSKSSSSSPSDAGLFPPKTNGETPAFLKSLFPEHVPAAHPFASPIRINSQPDSTWDGFVLSLPGKPQTLYVDGSGAAQHMLRERYDPSKLFISTHTNSNLFLYSVVALLDLADEHFNCSALVIALPRTTDGLDQLIHSLMYVGGQVVTHPPFMACSSYVLIGLEI